MAAPTPSRDPRRTASFGSRPAAPAEPAIRLQLLGPLRIWRGDVELQIGQRQPAYLLALLLARGGRPTSTEQLVELLWNVGAPASARNVIYKYLGTLRRLLEPTLAHRETGSYLVRRGDGYVCLVGPGMLDLVTFREGVAAAKSALGQLRHEAALDRYVEALHLWSGPAGDGLASGPAGTSVMDSLDNEFFDAGVAAAQLAVALGQPERVLAPLHLAARMAPLHEAVQAGLVTVLGAAGQQAQAMSLFRDVRSRLARDLDIGPGAALRAAHQRVLSQTLPMLRTSDRVVASSSPSTSEPTEDRPGVRAEERAELQRAVDPAHCGGTALVLVEGEPGTGKTCLLDEVRAEAAHRNAFAIRAGCPDAEGTPPIWPWVQVVDTLLGHLPEAQRQPLLAGGLHHLVSAPDDLTGPTLPPGGMRFRVFDRVVDLLHRVARARPVILTVDDLQWADPASLQLLAHLVPRMPDRTALIGAFRDRAPVPSRDLTRLLAAASRVSGHRRIRLGSLNLPDVTELVRREAGRDPTPDAARRIQKRTSGNAFLIRELSRLLPRGAAITDDLVARTEVPSTVRDVARDRTAGLDRDTQDLLFIAALMGSDIRVDLLARVAELPVPDCLHRLEPVEELGLLRPAPGDPFTVCFSHELIREAIAELPPVWQATRIGARITQARREGRPGTLRAG